VITEHLARYTSGGYTARLVQMRKTLGCDP
jgi:hypothetical protein